MKNPPESLKWHGFDSTTAATKLILLEYAQQLYDFFSATNDTVQRSLAYNSTTGEWVDIVYWHSREAALRAADDILVTPQAQPFLQSINASTLALTHFTIALDWKPLARGPVVEVALFPLVHGKPDKDFVEDARATTRFFESCSAAAKHRCLARGLKEEENFSLWLDLVYWTSVDEAIQAAQAIEEEPTARPFLKDMDVSSARFRFDYFTVALWQNFV